MMIGFSQIFGLKPASFFAFSVLQLKLEAIE